MIEQKAGPVVGVDVGGTKIAAACVDERGQHGRIVSAATPAEAGAEAILDVVAAVTMDAAGGIPAAVGVGCAGSLRDGVVVASTDTLAGWQGTDVADGLRARLRNVPVRVINDVDAHLLGEAWVGAAAGRSSAVLVAVGTGVGGSLLSGGELIFGHHGLGGEIGHLPVPQAVELTCSCGRRGHLEAVASGWAICRRFTAGGGEALDTREVARLAQSGDLLAKSVICAAASAVGTAVAGLATTFDPELVILGGGVIDIGETWWSPFERAYWDCVVPALRNLPVQRASLGGAAPIVGAARLVFEGGGR